MGHTRHEKLAKGLVPWVRSDDAAETRSFYRLHADGEEIAHGHDVRGDGALMIFTDVGVHERDVVDVTLLELDVVMAA